MVTRSRSRCERDAPSARLTPPALPARRSACRRTSAAFDERLYIVVPEDGATSVDVLRRDGTFLARYLLDDRGALAGTLLRDATGHPPRPATAGAFAHEVLDRLPRGGFAISSGEVCAWLLLRAIT
ncbi:MAG TPA: hypothetical protein VI318_25070 [Baekduia sp.]